MPLGNKNKVRKIGHISSDEEQQMRKPTQSLRLATSLVALFALSGCLDGFDLDMRDGGTGLSTKAAAANAVADRPRADDRGVISYPNFQVAVAEKGDTVASVASRIGMDATQLAAHNGLQPATSLSKGAVLSLPKRVSEPTVATGADAGGIDITTLASAAIDRADGDTVAAPVTVTPSTPIIQAGPEPVRHRVERGETVYSISRLYNVPVRALAKWNGLGATLGIRTGQTLLIPVAGEAKAVVAENSAPGEGSATPTPPSASLALPKDDTVTKPKPAATPDLGANQTAASADTGQFAFPVQGSIINPYKKGKNEGIDIATTAGKAVKAAGNGTVAAITRDVDQVPILVIRHSDNILTVYANIDGIKVAKGDKITRGQTVAVVRKSNPAFVHFEIRKGFESVDPLPFLQ